MTILIPNLAISGYRSFGKDIQYFEKFSKINILIGQNNAGKSNVLRFLHEIYQKSTTQSTLKLDLLDMHLPSRPPTLAGIAESVCENGTPAPAEHRIYTTNINSHQREHVWININRIFKEKSRLDGTNECWSIIKIPNTTYENDSWHEAMRVLNDNELSRTWSMLFNMSGGDRRTWEKQLVSRLSASLPQIKTELIPAIRKIGSQGSTSELFDGTGIIERIAKLQNPSVHDQKSKRRFLDIQSFLRDVIDRPDAEIEVPYERDTILVHMDGKVLPIESLGSGIHEVLILASAATVLQDYVVCIEEPELHLNPILQKKLLRYLATHTDNQYFITTHSAALMDTPNAEVYHVRLKDGASIVERASSDQHRATVCEDLGYHPSDLLQANCIIWVEGPSDRIYINWWLNEINKELIEGIHYSIMFYGGRLASHLSQAWSNEEISNFISLRKLNQRGVMLIDSDRDSPHKPINSTKKRLQSEFDSGPGHAWITSGREIENYIPSAQIFSAITKIHPSATATTKGGKFDSMLNIKSAKDKITTASKVDIARHIVQSYSPDLTQLDLTSQLEKLNKFIITSNPIFRSPNKK